MMPTMERLYQKYNQGGQLSRIGYRNHDRQHTYEGCKSFPGIFMPSVATFMARVKVFENMSVALAI